MLNDWFARLQVARYLEAFNIYLQSPMDVLMQDESEQVKLPDSVGNGLALSLYEQGIRFHESGKFDEALAAFEEALKHDPQFAPAHNGRGSVLFSKGDVEAALSALNEAIRLDGKFPKALANRGSTYASIGEFERALADLNEALRLDSECEAAFIGRAQCFFGMQRYEDAIEDLSRCIDF
ncbi:MAG TPA: tetratricopeptide repeat protein, partial [Pirellulaceae bacterium]|nr:tetratricopeptide repeat protein [Pirellulaceae bacterium]